MKRRKRTPSWTTSVIALCSDCGLSFEDRDTAARQGKAHYLKTGHSVTVERAVVTQYKSSSFHDDLDDDETDLY